MAGRCLASRQGFSQANPISIICWGLCCSRSIMFWSLELLYVIFHLLLSVFLFYSKNSTAWSHVAELNQTWSSLQEASILRGETDYRHKYVALTDAVVIPLAGGWCVGPGRAVPGWKCSHSLQHLRCEGQLHGSSREDLDLVVQLTRVEAQLMLVSWVTQSHRNQDFVSPSLLTTACMSLSSQGSLSWLLGFRRNSSFHISSQDKGHPPFSKQKGSPLGLGTRGHCCSLLVLREELEAKRKPDAVLLKYLDYVN